MSLHNDQVDEHNADTTAGELIHITIVVHPDTTINRVAALGACVCPDADDTSHAIGKTIETIQSDGKYLADTPEVEVLKRFYEQPFKAIETGMTALETPATVLPDLYTYARPELEALAEGPATAALTPGEERPTPDGWCPIRLR